MPSNTSFMDPTSPHFGWAILLATFLGPILAVLVTRFLDHQRELRGRRMHVFRTLMSSRRGYNNNEFTAALNLIEIEFQGKPRVIQAWRAYFKHLGTVSGDPNRADDFLRERLSLL